MAKKMKLIKKFKENWLKEFGEFLEAPMSDKDWELIADVEQELIDIQDSLSENLADFDSYAEPYDYVNF